MCRALCSSIIIITQKNASVLNSMSEKVSVNINKALVNKINEKIAGTSITSAEEYIELLLENEFPKDIEYTAEEEEIIRERLRRLGYVE